MHASFQVRFREGSVIDGLKNLGNLRAVELSTKDGRAWDLGKPKPRSASSLANAACLALTLAEECSTIPRILLDRICRSWTEL